MLNIKNPITLHVFNELASQADQVSYPIFNRVRIAMVALVAMIALKLPLEALISMVALIAMNALIANSSKCLLNKISEVEIEETR